MTTNAMTADGVKRAVREAKRFIEAAKAQQVKHSCQVIDGGDFNVMYRCKENGSLRRASLDLSRALVDLVIQ